MGFSLSAGAVSFAQIVKAAEPAVAAAFRGQENKRVMADPELKTAVGGAGNTYAITTIWATIMLLPSIAISGEFARLSSFQDMWAADGKKGTIGNLQFNTAMSGLTFYLYNEVSTIALKKISGVTHSVANTAKRSIIIVGCAIAFGESMAPVKMLGCAIAIGGTFLYAIADDLFPA